MTTRFFVRVELHSPPTGSYGSLHKEMKARGFKRTVTLDDVEQRLPTGCYIGRASKVGTDRQAAMDKAKAAANAVHSKHSIVVVETDEPLTAYKLDPG